MDWRSPKEKTLEEEVAAWLATQPPSPTRAPLAPMRLAPLDVTARQPSASGGTGGSPLDKSPVPPDIAAFLAAQKPPPPVDTEDRGLLAAQGLAAQQRLFAGLGRAGATIGGAIAGTKTDAAPWDAMDANSDQAVKDYVQRKGAKADNAKAAEQAALKDKGSAQSRAFQARIAKLLPGMYSPEDIGNMTAGDSEQVLEYGKMKASLEERKAAQEERNRAARTQEGFHRDDMSERGKDRALQRQFQAEQNALTREGRLAEVQARAKAEGGAKHDKEFEKDVQNAGKDLQDTTDLVSDVNHLAKVANEEGSLAGLGWWDSRKPNFLNSADDTAVQQSIKNVLGARIKATTGATATPQEMERIASSYGLQAGASEEQARLGLRKLAADTKRALATRQARYRPEVLSTFKERGGVLASDVQAGGAEPEKPGASPTVIEVNGKRYRRGPNGEAVPVS
jgi:hypothetical protein